MANEYALQVENYNLRQRIEQLEELLEQIRNADPTVEETLLWRLVMERGREDIA